MAAIGRPRLPLAFESSLIGVEAKQLARVSASATHRLVLVAAEARTADLRPIAPILKEAGVRVVAAPFTLSDLDQVVEPKLSRARRVRR